MIKTEQFTCKWYLQFYYKIYLICNSYYPIKRVTKTEHNGLYKPKIKNKFQWRKFQMISYPSGMHFTENLFISNKFHIGIDFFFNKAEVTSELL